MKIAPPPKNILYEDADVMVVFDHDPITIGHVLILPKIEYVDIDELPQPILLKIMQMAQVYVRLLKKMYAPAGYSIMQNGGTFNDIGQFHLHVFPRFNKEDFGWTYTNDVPSKAFAFSELKAKLKTLFLSLM